MSKMWFGSAKKQAGNVMKSLQGTVIKSVGTVRNYEQSLTHVAQAMKDGRLGSLNQLTPQIANDYLASRAVQVGQSALNMERQAMQALMQHYNHQLEEGQTLPVMRSEQEQVLESRAYTSEQVQHIAQHQTSHNALATEIAYQSGLRAHELYTLRPMEERSPDLRPTHEAKFEGREGHSYTVVGKGGLIREVKLSDHLHERLQLNRLSESTTVTDRGIRYEQHYHLGAGNSWSASFSRASEREFDWSNGAHGVRHSYAQERMDELQRLGHDRDESLLITSQEMGHFRPEITETYLR